MALRVRCPICWETAEISEEMLGRSGLCNSCGASVQIPSSLNKVCFICGDDVTHGKHAKDEDNNYLCAKCWRARNQDEQAEFVVVDEGHAASAAIEEPAQTAILDAPLVPAFEPITSSSMPAARYQRPAVRGVWTTFLGALCILSMTAAILLAVLQFRKPATNWEDQNRLRILILKAQAEVLVEVSKNEAAANKYREMLKLAEGQLIADAEISMALKHAKAEYDRMLALIETEEQNPVANRIHALEKRPSANSTDSSLPPTHSRPQTTPTIVPAAVTTSPVQPQSMPATAPTTAPSQTQPTKPPQKTIFESDE